MTSLTKKSDTRNAACTSTSFHLLSANAASAHELRQYRKMIPKKRILERNNAEQPTSKVAKVTQPPSSITAKNNQRPLKKRIRKVASKQEDEEEAMDDEMADGGGVGVGGGAGSNSNGLTLEQFTEIVLASEGMAPAAAAAAEEAAAAAAAEAVAASTVASCGQELRQQRLPIIPQRQVGGGGGKVENNNKRPSRRSSEDEVVANLIQNNNDLIVEVKPMRPKPVVLSPRQPPFAHLLPYPHNPNPSLSSSVVVSVKPRLLSGSPPAPVATAAQPRLPPSKPQSIHRMMEEWFSKMQPPITEQASNTSEAAPVSTSPSASSAINLSTKSPEEGSTALKGMSRTTQVYLRPITTPPKLSSPVSTSSGNSSVATQKYNMAKRPTIDSPPKVETSVKKLGSPGLEVQKMEQKSVHRQRYQPRQQELVIGCEVGDGRCGGRAHFLRQIGRATPFEGQIQQQDARSRALRDVEMALTRDIHGNL